MKPECQRPVTLDDLLRLKRAERPAPEFWNEFDRQLRAKQLSALVQKRPWWQTLPRALAEMRSLRVGLGASAVAAITFLAVRPSHSPTHTTVVAPFAASPSTAVVSASPVSQVAGSPASEFAAPSLARPDSTVGDTVVAVSAVAAVEAASADELSRLVPLGGLSRASLNNEEESPSARHIASNLAVVQNAEPTTTRHLLGATTGFEARAMPVRAAVEPLQQMTPPGESRRSRLLTAMVATASLETSARTTERAASRIAEDRLYDQIHRFGARGDRVQVKF